MAVPHVLVLGGAGFIGRHTVAELRRRGCRVTAGIRRKRPKTGLLSQPDRLLDWRCIRLDHHLQSGDWRPQLSGVDAVINCVGLLRQRGRETYERIHCAAPRALAIACRERGIHLVHVSALGLSGSARSRFLTSKRRGEQALQASGAGVTIVRPSLLIGKGGLGSRWLQRVANWPVYPVPADAVGRIGAMRVEDLAQCLARLALNGQPAQCRQVELGGPQALQLAELLQTLRSRSGLPASCISVPAWLGRIAAHTCDLLHVTPFSFGHRELLRRDNLPLVNQCAQLLGREPSSVAAGPRPVIESKPPGKGEPDLL